MLTESIRTRLIGQIATMLQEPTVPAETRAAGLQLISWLARRMPQDQCPAFLPPVPRRRSACRTITTIRRAR